MIKFCIKYKMKDTSRSPEVVQKLFYHIDTRLHQQFLKKKINNKNTTGTYMNFSFNFAAI